MIDLVAFITAKSGKRGQLLKAMLANLPNVLEEDGCIEYRPTIDLDRASRIQTEAGPDTVVVIEKWRDRSALRKHMNAPHMVEYANAVKDLVSDRKIFFLGNAAGGRTN